MLRSILLALLLGLPHIAAPLQAQTQTAQPDVEALVQTLHIDTLIEVMRAEGFKSSASIADELFPGQGGAAWTAALAAVYDPKHLRARFDAQLAKTLAADPTTQAALTEFFATELGQRVLSLEIDARRSLLDDRATTAAKAAWGRAETAHSPRAKQIDRFVIANDLIETNLMGALNANLAFYRGLNAGGAFTKPMTESEMLDAVYAQETAIRKDTAEWLYPFLMLAYQSLSDGELDQYIAFSASASGKKSNAALFAAFGAMFVQASQDTGRAAARIMAGQDI